MIAVVGWRSFIGKGILNEASRQGLPALIVQKQALATEDFSQYDCVYLVLGRSKGTPADQLKEKQDVLAYLANPLRPRRTVYISSLDYQGHKLECERMLRDRLGRRVDIVRPAAVFGPGQDIDSPMLIPSIVREDGKLVLRTPWQATKFISMRSLSAWLLLFANPEFYNHDGTGEPHGMNYGAFSNPLFDIPGTFMMQPGQIEDLFEAFRSLYASSKWPPMCSACGHRRDGMC